MDANKTESGVSKKVHNSSKTFVPHTSALQSSNTILENNATLFALGNTLQKTAFSVLPFQTTSIIPVLTSFDENQNKGSLTKSISSVYNLSTSMDNYSATANARVSLAHEKSNLNLTKMATLPTLEDKFQKTSSDDVSFQATVIQITFSSALRATETSKISSIGRKNLKHIPQLKIPKFGIVNQELEFFVSNVFINQFRFLWSWGDGSAIEERPRLAHYKFSSPGLYHVTVKMFNSSYHVILNSSIVIQDITLYLHVWELSFLGENNLYLEFVITQGQNVEYSVNFGDGSGKKTRVITNNSILKGRCKRCKFISRCETLGEIVFLILIILLVSKTLFSKTL